MGILKAEFEHQFTILNEFDVVVIRQEVRQRARQLGMDLRKQARLTAVISSIAREFLAIACGLVVTLSRADDTNGPALDLLCAIPPGHSCPTPAEMTRIIGQASMLVDEVMVGGEPRYPLLMLRVIR